MDTVDGEIVVVAVLTVLVVLVVVVMLIVLVAVVVMISGESESRDIFESNYSII